MIKTPSVEPVVRSRLLPRISSRWLFLLTTLAAVIAAVARAAGEGGALAYAFTAVVIFLLVCFTAFVVLFCFARLISFLWYDAPPETLDGSPFADGQLPPQILPPRDPGA